MNDAQNGRNTNKTDDAQTDDIQTDDIQTDDIQTDETQKKDTLNFIGFFKSMARFFIYISIVVFLSSTFKILLSYYDPFVNNPNEFPGTNIDDVPYSENTKNIANGTKNLQGLSGIFQTFFPMNKWSFPYKNWYSQRQRPGIFGNIVLWITESIAYSNQLIRKLTRTIIEGVSEYKDNSYAFWLFGLLILLTLPFIPLIGLASGFIGPVMAIERIWVGWKIFLLLSLPFLIPASFYIFSIFTTTSILAYMQSIYTLIIACVFLLIFPFSLPNSSTLFKETLSKHRYGILRAVLLSIVINSFRYLNNGIGIGALILFILSLFGLV